MANGITARITTNIEAPASRVWEALTTPLQIKQYLFGTITETDWEVGHPIKFHGIYKDKPYEDKGVIKAFEPGSFLSYTYWSSMSGTEDVPENYATVSFSLQEKDGATELTLTQDNIHSEEGKTHSEENWAMVLKNLKELLEGSLGIDLK